MASRLRQLAPIAVIACLIYTAFAQEARTKQDHANIGSLSTQEIEEELEVRDTLLTY